MTTRNAIGTSAALVLAAALGTAAETAPPQVEVKPVPAQQRVDVTVGGQPFTSYAWPERIAKPFLNPIRTATGKIVTRGFPLEPRPGERVDHPHHVGLWLNFGDVNGVDFWGNSEAMKPDERAKMGTIRHREILSSKGGAGRGELVVRSEWLMPDGKVALDERTTYVLGATARARTIDRITALTAKQAVRFGDTKEGMLGLRVARALEQPADKPEVFVDAAGNPTKVPVLDNTGVSGQYVSSTGLKGDAVWGTAAPWVALTGKLEGEDVVLLILDHPKNFDHPTRWHARGYGLFAVNPFGRKAFTNGKEPASELALQPGQALTFHHRLVILSAPFTAQAAETEWKRFVAETAK
jgi:hypothetical protein